VRLVKSCLSTTDLLEVPSATLERKEKVEQKNEMIDIEKELVKLVAYVP